MRKLVCPQCQIPNFYLKSSNKSDILPIYINSDGEIVPKRDGDVVDGYDTETIYCLGCSWSGSVVSLLKYFRMCSIR